MGNVEHTVTKPFAWVGFEGSEVIIQLDISSDAHVKYTPEQATALANEILSIVGKIYEHAVTEKVDSVAAEAWEAAAEENEHTRQRQERAVTHAFDADQFIDPSMRYMWVVPVEGAAPDAPLWLGLWDRQDDVVAVFTSGLTDEGRRRTMTSLNFLIWTSKAKCPVFEIEVR